jgi:hypothetical protein
MAVQQRPCFGQCEDDYVESVGRNKNNAGIPPAIHTKTRTQRDSRAGRRQRRWKQAIGRQSAEDHNRSWRWERRGHKNGNEELWRLSQAGSGSAHGRSLTSITPATAPGLESVGAAVPIMCTPVVFGAIGRGLRGVMRIFLLATACIDALRRHAEHGAGLRRHSKRLHISVPRRYRCDRCAEPSNRHSTGAGAGLHQPMFYYALPTGAPNGPSL